MVSWLVLAALAGAAAPDTQQDPPGTFDEEVFVTASLEREELDRLPASATLIRGEEIRERQATAVLEVLRTVPGLSVAQSGSPGKVTSLFVRGAESNQSLVLWNGLVLNDPFFGGFDWAYLPTDGIGRVEIVRGPFSSLYGSSAMSGVVQVLSDQQEGGGLRLEGGSDAYRRAGVSWGGQVGSTRVDLAGHLRSGDGAADNDDYDGQDLMASFGWRTGASSRLGLVARTASAEVGIPVASGTATPRRRQESDALQLAVPFEAQWDDWRLEATLSRVEEDLVFSDPDAVFSRSDTNAERLRLRSVATYRAGGDFWIAGGLEWQEDEVTNSSNFGPNLSDESRRGWASFAELQKPLGRVRFDLGLRYDDDEFYGSQVSPRGALVADLGESLQVFASYGQGFRAPSLGELFFPFFGNEELEPEESESVEVGLRLEEELWWLGVAYFDNEFENLIDSDPITFTAVNVGRAQTSGWEIQVGYRRGLVELRAEATLLDTEDLDTGLTLLRRPEEQASLVLAVRPERWIVEAIGRYVGERDDLDPVTFARAVNDSYFVADLALTWQASATLAPYGRIVNIADESYQQVLGFPAPRRALIAGLEVSLP